MESIKPEKKEEVVQGDLFEQKPVVEASSENKYSFTEEELQENDKKPDDYNVGRHGQW